MVQLKVKYCKYIPFKSYYAICLFDYLIIRKEYENIPLDRSTLIHETIHASQARDFGIGWCGYFIFYILYLLEWLLKTPWALFGYDPYMNISFEREAYDKDGDSTYLETRTKFAWAKYVFKMRK